MTFGFRDGGDDGEHTGVGFVKISIYLRCGIEFSLEPYHLRDYSCTKNKVYLEKCEACAHFALSHSSSVHSLSLSLLVYSAVFLVTWEMIEWQ